VAFVNAWEDDTLDDPFTSIASALDRALTPLAKDRKRKRTLENVKTALENVGKAAVKGGLTKALSLVMDQETASALTKTGAGSATEALDALAESLSRERLKNYNTRLASIDNLKNELAKALNIVQNENELSASLPLFIFVDELDRCRPHYAVRLLENAKHLFDIPGVVFIYGMERVQLAAAVSGLYGDRFNGQRYLHRFINREFQLRSPSLGEFCYALLKKFRIPSERLLLPLTKSRDADKHALGVAKFTALWIENTEQLELRDAIVIFDISKQFTTLWTLSPTIEYAYLLPMIVNYFFGHSEDGLGSEMQFKRSEEPVVSWNNSPTGNLVGIRKLYRLFFDRRNASISSYSNEELTGIYAWVRDRISRGRSIGDTSVLAFYPQYLDRIAPWVETPSQRPITG